jgi:ADP-ribosyl-[dinitrogen reductase] hydrolase
MSNKELIKDALLGVAVGDAIGVPVEFRSRNELRGDPVEGIREYGSHGQPAGTWSDDSSLTFCLAEMLCDGYDLGNLARRFVNWEDHAYWTPHGEVFDIGMATASAISRLRRGIEPVLAGGTDEGSNGNGSLMRILPLVFYTKDKDIEQRFELTNDVSSLTHRHFRSIIACFIYLEIALELIGGKEKGIAYHGTCDRVAGFLKNKEGWNDKEQSIFSRILSGNIFALSEEEIRSSGYVVHTLEAAIWCLFNTTNYPDAVLKAANLGEDTDTTAAVTGGLAGLLYGWTAIPGEWLKVLAKRTEIEQLADRLTNKLNK